MNTKMLTLGKISMSKVGIITDSNSGILQSESTELGIYVIPMPFTIDMDEFFEEISITQDEFYDSLKKDLPVSTSQPSEYYLEELWEEQLQKYDELVYIPMSSGLSKTCENAINYAEKFNGKVLVVDNKRISVTLKESIMEAIALRDQGKSAKEIKYYLESTASKSSIYITMGVLKYLKKGGRISPAAAMIGDMLKLKPILSSRGGSFEKFSMALSMGQAKKKMVAQIRQEIETEFLEEYKAGKMTVSVAHTNNLAEALKFKEEILRDLPKLKFKYVDPLSLSVSCHIGPGSLAIAMAINNFEN